MKSSFFLVLLLLMLLLIYTVEGKNSDYKHCLKLKETLPDIDCEIFKKVEEDFETNSFLSKTSVKENKYDSILKVKTVDDVEIDLNLLENPFIKENGLRNNENKKANELEIGYFKLKKH